jgi:hypothetical protein
MRSLLHRYLDMIQISPMTLLVVLAEIWWKQLRLLVLCSALVLLWLTG